MGKGRWGRPAVCCPNKLEQELRRATARAAGASKDFRRSWSCVCNPRAQGANSEMYALSFNVLLQAINREFGVHDVVCPLCGPDRRSPANRVRKVLRIWHVSSNFVSYACARCGETGFARERGSSGLDASTYARVRAELEEHRRAAAAVRLSKAIALWRSRRSVRGSIGETYLREARGYSGPLPPTLGFLPARNEYPPAIIAAFGIADEPEPGAIFLPETKIKGVHLTRLASDGGDRDRGDKGKIMIGFSKGWPITLSSPTDGLGLIVCEGIENGLSAFEATGLCAWAAGCASRLPALVEVVPEVGGMRHHHWRR
jgi:hypothetical protein